MRVLHLDSGSAMQGGQWQVTYLLHGLVRRGMDCRLLAPAGSPLLAAARKLGFDAQESGRLRVLRHAAQFDLIHAHDAGAHTLALLCACPLVVSRRVAFPLKRTPFSRFKYNRPAHFLAVSHYVQNVLLNAGIPEHKISVVYDGVPLPLPSSPENRTRVVALRSEHPGKGQAIVEGASHIAGIPVHFSSALQADLPQAWLFVYITELEGLGSAALLAMAHGVPVLASGTGGMPEIVEHRVTGLLTGNDANDIATAIRSLDADRPAASNLGRNGRAAVEQRFTTDHMVENTIRAYKQVLAC